jgi:DNA mismatch endonuclease (patch repair protein)
MVDVHSPEKRSHNMSCVRSRGNKTTELKFVAILKSEGITGWRRHYRLFGHPDFVFPKQRIAVFVDGCFWHSCPHRCKPPPRNNEFWNTKIEGNRKRDRLMTRKLRSRGWIVVRIWEHDLRVGARAAVRRIQTVCGQSVPQSQQSTPEEQILAYVREKGSIGNSECQALLAIDDKRAWYLLKKLADNGILSPIGRGNGRRYGSA